MVSGRPRDAQLKLGASPDGARTRAPPLNMRGDRRAGSDPDPSFVLNMSIAFFISTYLFICILSML